MSEAMEKIDYNEFALWIAYHSIEPWTPLREDWRAKVLASEIANIAPAMAKGRRPYKPSDFDDMFVFTRTRRKRRIGRAGLPERDDGPTMHEFREMQKTMGEKMEYLKEFLERTKNGDNDSAALRHFRAKLERVQSRAKNRN